MKEVNLKDMTEADWEKYRRMKKIAESSKLDTIIYLSVMLFFLFAFIIYPFYSLLMSNNYTLVKNLPPVNFTFNSTQFAFIYNKTLSNATKSSMLISALQNKTLNAKALAFATETSFLSLIVGFPTLSILILLTIYLLVIVVFPSDITSPPSTIRSKSGLQEVLKYYQKARNRLLAHNYTEADVQWYFAVRAKIISLKTNPYAFEELINEIKEVK